MANTANGASAVLRQARKAARGGFFAWPGGYQMAAVMADGAVLCCKCFRKEYRRISAATREGGRSGWELGGVDVLWEGPSEICCHCGCEIETTYGPSEDNAQ